MSTISFYLPFFEGFYESTYSYEFDWAVDREIDYLTEEGVDLTKYPPLDDIWYTNSYYKQWQDYKKQVCKEFLSVYNDLKLPLPLNLTFDKLVSPAYYNNATDKVFVTAPEDQLRNIYAWLLENHRDLLAKTIKDNHTSCSGFVSFITNELGSEDWNLNPSEIDIERVAETVVEAYILANESKIEWLATRLESNLLYQFSSMVVEELQCNDSFFCMFTLEEEEALTKQLQEAKNDNIK